MITQFARLCYAANHKGGIYLLRFSYLWHALVTVAASCPSMVLGGLIGFVISATAAAIVFAFAQIELNTRVVARYHAERTKTERAIDRVVKARE